MINLLPMRYLLPLLLLFSFNAKAQSNLHLSFHAGFLIGSYEYNTPDGFTDGGGTENLMLELRMWKEFGRHLQAGVSVETGFITTTLYHALVRFNNNTRIEDDFHYTAGALISPYIAPNVFGHYKLYFHKERYVYGGVMLGMISGSNETGAERISITQPLGGVNIGVSFPLSERARFTVNHGFRYTYINLPDGPQYVDPPDDRGNYSYYTTSDFGLFYAANSISLFVNL